MSQSSAMNDKYSSRIVKPQNVNGGGVYYQVDLKLTRKNADALPDNDVLTWEGVVEYLKRYYENLPKILNVIGTTQPPQTPWENIYQRICLYDSGFYTEDVHDDNNTIGYSQLSPEKKVFVVYILVHIVCKMFLQGEQNNEIVNIIDNDVDVTNEKVQETIIMLFPGYNERPLSQDNQKMPIIYLDALVLFIIRELLSNTTAPTKTAIANWNKIIYNYCSETRIQHLLQSVLPAKRGNGARGLKNIGVTCYMNSIMQCFNSIPEIVHWAHNNKIADQSSDDDLPTVLSNIIKDLWKDSEDIDSEGIDSEGIEMSEYVGKIAEKLPTDTQWLQRQQDSSEFMIKMIEYLSKTDDTITNLFKGKEVVYPNNIVDLYFIQINLQTNLQTIEENLQNSLNNKQIIETPKVLAIIISRNMNVRKNEKNTTKITITSLELKLRDLTYDLTSVSCHQGNETACGHYITIAKSPTLSDMWYTFNDSTVTNIGVDKVIYAVNEQASNTYIYFYRRRDACEPLKLYNVAK